MPKTIEALSVTVQMDVQEVYDGAEALAEAFGAFAAALRERGGVCSHPFEKMLEVDPGVYTCGGCNRVVRNVERVP